MIEEAIEYPNSDVVGFWLRPRKKWISLGNVQSLQIVSACDTEESYENRSYVTRSVIPASKRTDLTVDLNVTNENYEQLRATMDGEFDWQFPISIRTQYDRFDLERSSAHAVNTWHMEFRPGQPALSHLAFRHLGDAVYTEIRPRPKIGWRIS